MTMTMNPEEDDDPQFQSLHTIPSPSSFCSYYEAIIFDIDGTLCDSWKLGFDATQTVLKQNGIMQTTPSQYHKYTRYATPDRLTRHAQDSGAAAAANGGSSDTETEPNDVDYYTRLGQKMGKQFDELYIGLVSTKTAGFYPGIYNLLTKIGMTTTTTTTTNNNTIILEKHENAVNNDDDNGNDDYNGNDDGKNYRESATIATRQQRQRQRQRYRNVQLGALTNASVEYALAVFRVNLEHQRSSNDDDDDHDIQTKTMDPTAPTTTATTNINFKSIHGADTAPQPKPAPDGLILVCQELDVKPTQQSVYVGDSPSDAVAAKAAGLTAIGVTWGSHSRESLKDAPFDILCDTVEELEVALGL